MIGRNMATSKFIIILVSLSFLAADRGDLIEAQVVSTRDVNNSQVYINNELDALAGESFFDLTVEYGYWFYKIVYETIDFQGNPTQASGVVAYPRVDWPNIERWSTNNQLRIWPSGSVHGRRTQHLTKC